MKHIVVILICFLVPIGLLTLLMRKKSSVWISFLIGVLAFVISQIILRIPLLQFLQDKLSVQFFAIRQPILWILLLALGAGIFEEIARYIGFLCIRKHHQSLFDALAFGLGHGGIEAMLLVGIPLLHVSIPVQEIGIAMLERCFAMLAHVMMSIIVWYGVKEKKFIYVMIAIFVHMGLDCYPLLGNNIWLIEGYVMGYAILLSVLCYRCIIKKVLKHEISADRTICE